MDRCWTYCWIEQATSDAEEDPSVDSKRETKGQCNVQQGRCVGCLSDGTIIIVLRGGITSSGVGDLGSAESEEQKEKGSDELANDCDELVADLVREPTESSEAAFMLVILAVFHEREGEAPAWTIEIHDGLCDVETSVCRRDAVVVMVSEDVCCRSLLCDECTK